MIKVAARNAKITHNAPLPEGLLNRVKTLSQLVGSEQKVESLPVLLEPLTPAKSAVDLTPKFVRDPRNFSKVLGFICRG